MSADQDYGFTLFSVRDCKPVNLSELQENNRLKNLRETQVYRFTHAHTVSGSVNLISRLRVYVRNPLKTRAFHLLSSVSLTDASNNTFSIKSLIAYFCRFNFRLTCCGCAE